MKNKEAVRILENMKVKTPLPKAAVTQQKRNEALDLAVRALSNADIPDSPETGTSMTIKEVTGRLSSFIICLKCEISGKECDPECGIQYKAGTMGEIVEALETAVEKLKSTDIRNTAQPDGTV